MLQNNSSHLQFSLVDDRDKVGRFNIHLQLSMLEISLEGFNTANVEPHCTLNITNKTTNSFFLQNNPCKQSQPWLTHSSYYKLMHISGVNADFSISINHCLPSYLWSVLIFIPASTIDVHLRQQKLSTRGNLHQHNTRQQILAKIKTATTK